MRLSRFARIAVLALPLACTDGTGIRGNFTLELGEIVLAIIQGRSAAFGVHANRDGFDGPIRIGVRSLPAGVSATLSATQLTREAPSITVTLAATSTAALGTTSVFVDATAEGIGTKTAEVQLTVREPPGFTLAVVPNDLTVTLGRSATAALTFARQGGFSDFVSLSSTGLPGGVSVTFLPGSVPGNTSVATFSADLSTSLATATATIHAAASGGAATGIEPRNAPVTLRFLPEPSITTSLSAPSLNVVQGANGKIRLVVGRTNFTGGVDLKLLNVPASVTPSFSANPVPDGTSSVDITFAAAPETPAGATPVTLEASGPGIATRSNLLNLIVTEPPSFTLSSPAAVTVTQGQSATFTASIARAGGFSGGVSLAASNLPSGVTASFDPTIAMGTESVVTLFAPQSTVVATTTALLTASATGLADRTRNFELTVRPAPAITLSLSIAELAVLQGASNTLDLTIGRTGFTGDVFLSVLGLPPGVTPSFSLNPVPHGTSLVTLQFSATTTATTGTSQVTVRASGLGFESKDILFGLTVNASTPPGYTLALLPSTITVNAGATATATVQITRQGGFSGDIMLGANSLPSGVSAAFNPQQVTGNSSTASFTAVPTALPTGVGGVQANIVGTTSLPDVSGSFQVIVPGIDLNLAAASLTVERGSSKTIALSIGRLNYAGDVTLSAPSLPSGVSLSSSVNPVPNGTSQVILTFGAASSATPGTTSVGILASGTGIATRQAPLSLTVTDPQGFTLSLPSLAALNNAVSVQRGQTATASALITRTGGFSNAVTLSSSGLPGGVTATFNPTIVTGTESVITFAATSIAELSAATPTASILADATGLSQRSAPVGLPCLVRVPLTYPGTVSGNLAPGDCDLFPTFAGGEADYYTFTTTSDVTTVTVSMVSADGTGNVTAVVTDAGGVSTNLIFVGHNGTTTRKLYLPQGSYTIRLENGTGSPSVKTYSLSIAPESNADFLACSAGPQLARPFPGTPSGFAQTTSATDCFTTMPVTGAAARADRVWLSLASGEVAYLEQRSDVFQPAVRLEKFGPGGHTVVGTPSCQSFGTFQRCFSVMTYTATSTGAVSVEMMGPSVNLGAYNMIIRKEP